MDPTRGAGQRERDRNTDEVNAGDIGEQLVGVVSELAEAVGIKSDRSMRQLHVGERDTYPQSMFILGSLGFETEGYHLG